MTEQAEDLRSSRIGAVPPGEPYCNNCGYSLRGLDDSSRCPECGKPIVEVLMRKEFAVCLGRRYQSKTKLLGLPLIDIAVGPFGAERRGKARGIIAIGDFAFGWLAIGAVARGIVAIGGIAMGIFAVGGVTIGLLTACGGLALCAGIASGGLTVGSISLGGLAIGAIAQGGVALGIYARGGVAFGKHFPPTLTRFHRLLGGFPPGAMDANRPLLIALAPAIFFSAVICLLVISRFEPSNQQEERNVPPS